jgi:hypothetical protein
MELILFGVAVLVIVGARRIGRKWWGNYLKGE